MRHVLLLLILTVFINNAEAEEELNAVAMQIDGKNQAFYSVYIVVFYLKLTPTAFGDVLKKVNLISVSK